MISGELSIWPNWMSILLTIGSAYGLQLKTNCSDVLDWIGDPFFDGKIRFSPVGETGVWAIFRPSSRGSVRRARKSTGRPLVCKCFLRPFLETWLNIPQSPVLFKRNGRKSGLSFNRAFPFCF